MVAAAEFARHLARTIDRVSIAARLAITPNHLEPLASSFKVPPAAAAMIVGFMPPDGATWDEIGLVVRYAPAGAAHHMADQLARAEVVTVTDQGVAYTVEGRRCAQAVVDLVPAALTELWTCSEPVLARCAALVTPIAQTAIASGRPSPVLFNRPLEPSTSNLAYQLAHNITIIRRLRADCHAQAWTEAGHTTATIQQLTDATTRKPIEDRTDHLNAPIWTDLDEHHQLDLLAILGGLNGIGDPT